MESSKPHSPISVILVDDHSLVRNGIRSLLEEEQDIEVIGEAANGLEAIKAVNELKPDVMIIDIRMPKLGGIETLVELQKEKDITTKSIILSMHDSEEYILKSIKAGVHGYLLKDTDKSDFIKAIHNVYKGGKFFGSDVSEVLVNRLLNPSEPEKEESENSFQLTPTELKILDLILSGLTNHEIAERLQKSRRTIETHRFNLMKKMEVKNLMDLSRKAKEHNLIFNR